MQRRDLLRLFAMLPLLGLAPGRLSRVFAHGTHGESAGNRVRDLRRHEWLNAESLIDRLIGAGKVVIGESHDNPEHHRLERWLIQAVAARGELGGVAMEMLDVQQQAALQDHPSSHLLSLSDEALQETLDWQQGWPWSAYGATLRLALELDVPIRGANLTRQRIDEIVQANHAPELSLNVDAAQRRALQEGHCGMLPESMIDGMLAAQVARDQAMATALDELPSTSILICGNGHARRDIGVAYHADEKPLCLGLVELKPGQDWRAALPTSVDQAPPFDLAWFTTSVADRQDPCVALREHFTNG